jgi:ankyrin repeat protein
MTEVSPPDGRTSLHYVCQHGRIDAVKQIVTDCKCSIESEDGFSPLHTAAQYGQVEILKYLLGRLFNNNMPGFTIELTSSAGLPDNMKSMIHQKLSDTHRDQRGNTHSLCPWPVRYSETLHT